jgi:hypothetical protein
MTEITVNHVDQQLKKRVFIASKIINGNRTIELSYVPYYDRYELHSGNQCVNNKDKESIVNHYNSLK